MWHQSWRNVFFALSVSVSAAACGGGGSPASPSLDPDPDPGTDSITQSFEGTWRGTYRNGSIDVMSTCRGQDRPLDFYNPYAKSEMTVVIGQTLAGEMRIEHSDGTLTCPVGGRLDDGFRLVATVAGANCMPRNVRVPAQGYVLAAIPPGCQSRPAEPRDSEARVELRSLDITAAVVSPSPARDYHILTFLTAEEGHFHDPAGDYYTGAYTGEGSAQLTDPEDPRVE